jgi:hypothetical protein
MDGGLSRPLDEEGHRSAPVAFAITVRRGYGRDPRPPVCPV